MLADAPLFGLPLPELWFALVFATFAAFIFLDGFDFGAGVLYALRDDEHEREQLLAAVGPFWDGNEVWLVVFGGALFAAFPAVYANVFTRYYLLMFAILAALVFRGLAPEMIEQREDAAWRRWWGRSFVVGSVTAPLFLGAFVGNWVIGAERVLTLTALLVGLTVVALTLVEGVAFVRLKTRGSLRRDLGPYGVRAAIAYLALVVLVLGVVAATEPALRPKLLSPLVLGLVVASVVLLGVYVAATTANRFYLAFATSGGLAFALVAVVAGLMYPTVDPVTGLTVREAIVSTLPLNLMTIGASFLLPLVVTYFVVLYSAFSGPIDAEGGY
jgi:cytochrome d ubiquinol oxidase subunit II